MTHYLIAFGGVLAWGLAWLWLYRSLTKPTRGTRIAAQARARCNGYTDAKRKEMLATGLSIINRNRRGGRLGRLLEINGRIQ